MTRLFAGTKFDIPPECEDCGRLESACSCSPAQKTAAEARRECEANRIPPERQTARVYVQKRKGNRMATVVKGLTAAANDLPSLLAKLQASCGSGGAVKANDDLIELQGNHVQKVCSSLAEIGYRVKQ